MSHPGRSSDISTISTTAAPGPTPPTITQKLVAEFLGTFVLVFFGVGSVVLFGAALPQAPFAGVALTDLVAIGFTFGISVMVMVYAVGRISGGHFNPAVSLGAALGGRVAWAEALVYMLVQLVSAIVAAALLFAIAHGFPGFSAEGRMGANGYRLDGIGIAWWAALILEVVLTFVFVFVILAVTDIRNEHPALAPLAIGFTLAAIHFVAIPATGTSVNPARSLGPALFAGTDALKQLWLFIVAPLLGGALAGLVYPAIFGRGDDPVAGSGFRFGGRGGGAVPGYGAPDQLQQQWQQGGPGQEWQAQQYPPAQPQIGHTQPAAPGPRSPAPGQASQPGQAPPPEWNAPARPGWPAPGPDDPDDGRTQIRPQQ